MEEPRMSPNWKIPPHRHSHSQIFCCTEYQVRCTRTPGDREDLHVIKRITWIRNMKPANLFGMDCGLPSLPLEGCGACRDCSSRSEQFDRMCIQYRRATGSLLHVLYYYHSTYDAGIWIYTTPMYSEYRKVIVHSIVHSSYSVRLYPSAW